MTTSIKFGIVHLRRPALVHYVIDDKMAAVGSAPTSD